MAQMSDPTLISICEAKLNNALGWVGGLLSKERNLATSYYRGDLFGNEQDGRSKVVSRDVAEAIDGAMPSLIKVFAAVDTAVACKAKRKDTEESAKQATDYLNYLFQSQPNAFDLLQTWIKDGLLYKLGVVKSWWDDSEDVTTEEYEGLTKFQYLTLLSDEEVEPIEVKSYKEGKEVIDPGLFEQPPKAQKPPAMPAPPQANQGALPQTPANNPGMAPPQAQPPQPMMPQGPEVPPDDGLLYDCKIKRTKKKGTLNIKAIPPEEFLTDRRAISLEDATFCAHRSVRTVSDIIEMGVSREVAENLPGGTELDFNTEKMNRYKAEDESPDRWDTDSLDPAMRPVWVAECYLKVDYNDDGVTEWRKVTLAGSGGWKILFNEEAEGHPFSAWTPFKQPHKLFGESMADKTMDLQLIKSTVWRQTMDALYFNTAPQLVVVEGQANMDDVLTRRPGGVIRARNADAVTPLATSNTAEGSMQMLGYLDSVREARTGMRRWSPGLEGTELNPLASTATGVNAVEDSTQDTLDLIARNFGEQGLKPLFKRMLELTCKHQNKQMTVRLRDKWVDIDPSTWDHQMDMEVMVGLGTGNRDRQVQQILTMITQVDVALASAQGGLGGPLLNMDNVYRKLSRLTEAMGFKTTDGFYTDPSTQPPPPPKPNPEMAMVQGKLQLQQQQGQIKLQQTQQKAQLDAQIAQQKAAHDAQREDTQAQADMATDRMHAQNQAQLEQMKMEAERQREAMKMAHEIELSRVKASHDAAVSVYKAQVDAHAKALVAKASAKAKSKPKKKDAA